PSPRIPHVPGVSWRPQPARAATRRPGRSRMGGAPLGAPPRTAAAPGRPPPLTMVGEVNPAEARVVDSSRYPPHLSEAGFMQPCPRRIRATRGGATVVDTLSAFYVWEVPYYPAY